MPAAILVAHGASAAQPIPAEPPTPVAAPPQTRLDRLLDRAGHHLSRLSIYACTEHHTLARFRTLRHRYQSAGDRAEALLGRRPAGSINYMICETRYDHGKFTFHATRADYFLRRAERMIRRGETD